ncbi:uncharacterized protein ColSpa_01321 [Colletotrichum spaethianum]|uniref:Uncharacterized protein n=1 Tax=Colletotrichum spaethianum TaxID=700344 RepID=A0AA37L813_9PEZI|nr:uncharacterized protein ColSpa_01321 [Colletotrichum spaethianum]GKT41140.1 hypothetical protein ColSpa_01321 [Colletotrichum spaethianum]
MAFKTWLLTALVGLANGLASTDTITWGGDNSRAGYQTHHSHLILRLSPGADRCLVAMAPLRSAGNQSILENSN